MAAIELKPLPPQEAIDYFSGKGLRTSFAWQDVWQEEHARSFTVAKAMQLDVLEDIRGAVDRAIAEGTTFATFRDELEPLLQKKGWWGRQRQVDPLTGEERLVQLGSPRRLRTIFDVNLRTSYATGRWEQIQRTKRLRPYLRYVSVQDSRTRPEHLAWHGTILPADHDWWSSHYPPNGWNCRCTVRQLSAREAERLGGVTDAPQDGNRQWTNKRTGEIIRVPDGIDPGWGYNVGRAAEAAKRNDGLAQGLESGATGALLDKIAAARPAIAHQILRDIVRSADFGQQLRKPQVPLPVLRLPDQVVAAIGGRNPVAVFSPESLAKNLSRHPALAAEDYRQLPEMGARPTVIVKDGNQAVAVVSQGDRIWSATIKPTKSGDETFVTVFRRTRAASVLALVRRGQVLLGAWEE